MADLGFPFPERGGPGPAREFEELGVFDNDEPPSVRLPDGSPAMLVCRHADLRQVVTDLRFSRSVAATHGMTARSAESLALNSVDPPDHTRRRRTVMAAFTQRRTDALRPEIERTVDDLISRLLAGGRTAELIADFTRPLSVGIICRLVGLPAEDLDRFGPSVDVMMSTAGHTLEEISAAHRVVFDYFAESCDRRRAEPAGDDLLADLVAASGADGPLTRDEAIRVGYGVLIAGYETTTQAVAVFTGLLLADRSRWARLRRYPAELPTAVDELLRWTSLLASGGAPHAALADVPLGRTNVPAGQLVIPVFAAANRDPAVFDDPGELRLDRTPNPHLAFGYGRHLCPGAPLARAEIEIALGGLLRRIPTLAPVGPPQWRRDTFIRGLAALPVCW
jgi:cytochrome P450